MTTVNSLTKQQRLYLTTDYVTALWLTRYRVQQHLDLFGSCFPYPVSKVQCDGWLLVARRSTSRCQHA